MYTIYICSLYLCLVTSFFTCLKISVDRRSQIASPAGDEMTSTGGISAYHNDKPIRKTGIPYTNPRELRAPSPNDNDDYDDNGDNSDNNNNNNNNNNSDDNDDDDNDDDNHDNDNDNHDNDDDNDNNDNDYNDDNDDNDNDDDPYLLLH